MATAGRNTLIKERGNLRRFFSNKVKILEDMLKAEDIDVEAIETEVEVLQVKIDRIFIIDEQIIESLLSTENSDDEIQNEYESSDTYRLKWLKITRDVNKLVRNRHPRSVSNISCNTMVEPFDEHNINSVKRNFILPKLEMIKFNGDVKHWLKFWGQFCKIDNDPSIDNHDKLQYLLQATEPGSDARTLVESFPPSGDNYLKAIQHLKERFARDDLIIEVYIRELLGLVLSQAKRQQSLPLNLLYDQLASQLRSLETMGVTCEKNAAILYPMIESALPEDTLLAFERAPKDPSNDKGNKVLNLLNFIKNEVERNQRISFAKAGFSDTKYVTFSDNPNIPTAAALVNSNTNKPEKTCVWCDKSTHCSVECFKPIKMTLDERKDFLKKKKACTICLIYGHHYKKCKRFIKCIICSRRHNVLMCPDTIKEKDTTKPKKKSEQPEGYDTSLSLINRNSVTLLQTLLVQIIHYNKVITVRALIDNGAQRSYISKKVAQQLNLPIFGRELISHCVFGGIETQKSSHNVYSVNIKNLHDNFIINMTVLDEAQICGFLPRIKQSDIQCELENYNITLTDVEDKYTEIDLLIGADYLGYIMTGTIIHIKNGLMAINTKLGWTLQGKMTYDAVCLKNNIMTCISDIDIADLWKLETIGITDNTCNNAESDILKSFNENIRINKSGRYEVSLPWKDFQPTMMSNKDLAKKRLISTTKILDKSGNLSAYDKIFKEWLNTGIIEKIDHDDDRGFYLPHHAVIKESSITTRIRPVFDASAKDRNGISLNHCLEKGTNLLELLPKILIKFRMFSIGIISDIRKAFLQISLLEKERDFLKFLWWKDKSQTEILTYRHCRVVFGLTSSPFLLAATINFHLDNSPLHLQNTAQKLKHSFYVDNCVTSFETEDEAIRFINESKQLMSLAHFDLRGWITAPLAHNSTEYDIVSVLGLLWNTNTDELNCNFNKTFTNLKRYTKRSLLSVTQKIFDPIGWTSPVLLLPKLILQKTWHIKCGWDDDLPDEISFEYKNWFENIHLLKQCSIPRRLSLYPLTKCEKSIHVFCDASKFSYATCIFLRTVYNGHIIVRLITAKSRVAPSKQQITIPRLELLSALIATRLCEQVKGAFNLHCPIYYWSDSVVVLTWIKKKAIWSTFVQNRVNEIRKCTDVNNWFHIPGNLNPADLPSRGCDVKYLIKSSWWNGPDWLNDEEYTWPNTNEYNFDDMSNESINEELRKTKVNLVIPTSRFSDRLLYFSKYTKIVRTIGWIKRFCYNCKNVNDKRHSDLTYEEYTSAETILFKLIQSEHFSKTNMYKNIHISFFIDSEGLLRAKTKLALSEECNNFIFPIILPCCNIIIQRLVNFVHIKQKHVGIQTLMTILRESYWIIGARKTAKRILRNCITCQKLKAKAVTTTFAPLPKNRINNFTSTFEVCGIDLAGPLYLKSKQKCYIVLFTCAVYRAVHLELTDTLSTESFIMALRRFIARRGRCKIIYSDNGTNFVGTNNLFKDLDWCKITSESNIQRIKWIFIPPAAPWWGGWWERMVRLVKELLRRVLGRSSVNYIELETILCDVEAVINSRPLTYVTECDDLIPLTPNAFLQSLPRNEVCDLDEIDEKSLNRRMKYINLLRQNLRQRFRNEYLSLLVHKGKEGKYKLKVGDVVLIEKETKRVMWPMGVITEIFPDTEGITRKANVKTCNGILLRPIQKIYPLELTTESLESIKPDLRDKLEDHRKQNIKVQDKDRAITSKYGRVVKPPTRLNL